MAIKYTDSCNGCAECTRCGRDEPRQAVFCDSCGDEISDKVFTIDGVQYCENCVVNNFAIDVEHLV